MPFQFETFVASNAAALFPSPRAAALEAKTFGHLLFPMHFVYELIINGWLFVVSFVKESRLNCRPKDRSTIATNTGTNAQTSALRPNLQ